MKKLKIIVMFCCFVIILSSCSVIYESSIKKMKINKDLSGKELYAIIHYVKRPFNTTRKDGYINADGEVFIEPYFDLAGDFVEGYARVQIDNKYGILTSEGQYALEPDFSNCDYLGEEIIAYKDSEWSDWKLIKTDGSEIENVEYEKINNFYEGLSAVMVNGKWGFIDTNGQLIIEPEFDYVGFFREGLCDIKINEKWGFINTNGQLIVEPEFDFVRVFRDGLCDIEINEKWGLLNHDGNKLVEPKYDEIVQVGDDLILVKDNNEKWGYIDKKGNVVLDFKYDMAQAFSEGFAAVRINGKWGYINKQGTIKIEQTYDEATPFIKSIAKVKKDNKYWYIDKEGEIIREVEINYKNIPDFNDGMAAILVNGKYGFINEKRDVVIEPKYDLYKPFSEGFAVVGYENPNRYESSYGYIDKKGFWLVEPNLTDAYSFRNGIAKVWFFGSMGYINQNGDYIYKDW